MKQEPEGDDLHFLLRYSDRLRGVDTFGEHMEILKRAGTVWLGKFGMGASQAVVDAAKLQISRGRTTYLYLAAESEFAYRAPIADLIGGGMWKRYAAPDRSLVPKYYRDDKCTLWFKLTSIKAHKPSLVLYNDRFSRPKLKGSRSLVYVAVRASR